MATKVTVLRARGLRDEIDAIVRKAEAHHAPGDLAESLALTLGSLDMWLMPPEDEFQLRNAIADAERIIGRYEAWLQAHAQPVPGPGRRQHERVRAEGIVVNVTIGDAARLERFFLRDISGGGTFLRSTKTVPVGTLVTIQLVIPGGDVVSIHGEVVRAISAEQAKPETASGLAVRFDEVTPELRARIASLVERLKTSQTLN